MFSVKMRSIAGQGESEEEEEEEESPPPRKKKKLQGHNSGRSHNGRRLDAGAGSKRTRTSQH